MYHTFETVKDMHVEITNRCNAACPMCARNDFGGKTKEDLELDEWSKDDINNIFNKQFPNLENVMFCGTHGDPCVAKESLYAIERIKETTDATVEFYSNASLRTTKWWTELGKMMQDKKPDHKHYRKNDLAIFSVDGLSDTNHLYRRRTNFEKIMENAEAYIKAGGIARWDFIVFKHNEHQQLACEALATEHGFARFTCKDSARFVATNKFEVLDKNGQLEYYLEPPTGSNITQQSQKFQELTEQYGNIEKYYDIAPIECLYKNEFKRIYVNAYAQVFPCCYISDDSYPHKNKIYQDKQKKIFEKYGLGFNSLRKHIWKEILEHPWLANELESSWSKDLAGGKLMRCARTCGKGYSPIKSQSTDTSL